MRRIKFSIVTVCLNPGEKLAATLESVCTQTYGYWEMILKDGGSTDGSVERIGDVVAEDPRVRLVTQPDTGIYDAMNQAADYVTGDYVLFLNCGDRLINAEALERAADRIARGFDQNGQANKTAASGADGSAKETCGAIFYGDTYGLKNNVLIAASPVINGFVCYRNIPCHQSCFYAAELVRRKPYDPQYRIRADYDHFLWCFYRAHAEMHYLGMTVSAYEGEGFSENPENRKLDREEHRRITKDYIPTRELRRYRLLMALTLAPLRSALAESGFFSGAYHRLKGMLYGKQ